MDVPKTIIMTRSDEETIITNYCELITADSPHFGNLWGAEITVHDLNSILGNCHMNFKQFDTVIIQIEGIRNS